MISWRVCGRSKWAEGAKDGATASDLASDLDILRSAKLLIDQHGEHAVLEAAIPADELLDLGDLDGQRVWRSGPRFGSYNGSGRGMGRGCIDVCRRHLTHYTPGRHTAGLDSGLPIGTSVTGSLQDRPVGGTLVGGRLSGEMSVGT